MLQSFPVKPATHSHVSGATHLPCCEHGGSQTGVPQSTPTHPFRHVHTPGVLHVPSRQPAGHSAVWHSAPAQPGEQWQ